MVELDQVAEIRGGATPRRDEPHYWGGDVPWLTPTDLPPADAGVTDVEATADSITEDGLASCSVSLLPPGTVLFSSRATIGKIGIAAVPLTTNQGFANLIPRPGVESRYLAWCLHFHADRIGALAGSTTFKEVPKSALKRFRIPLPAPSEQRRIVEILDQADRLRRLRAEADARAHRTLPALFARMFGDPFTNPRGWATRKLGEIALTGSGGTPATRRGEYYGGGIPWVKSGELTNRIILSTEDTITEEGLRNSSAKWVEPGAILVAMYGATVGQVSLLGIRATTNQAVCAIQPHTEVVREYLSEFLRRIKPTLLSRRLGGAQPNISQQIIRELDVPMPPLPVQQRFSTQVTHVESALRAQALAAGRLSKLFDALLLRAFSGALTACWREAHMKELLQEMKQQAKALAEAGPLS